MLIRREEKKASTLSFGLCKEKSGRPTCMLRETANDYKSYYSGYSERKDSPASGDTEALQVASNKKVNRLRSTEK